MGGRRTASLVSAALWTAGTVVLPLSTSLVLLGFAARAAEWLSALRQTSRPGACAAAACRGRHPDRGGGRPSDGFEIRRSPAALSPGPALCPRQGVALDRSTLADWVGRAAFLLRPLHERMLTVLKASPKQFADETTAPVLDPGRGRTKIVQLWAYAPTTGPGRAPIRRALSMSMRQIARRRGR